MLRIRCYNVRQPGSCRDHKLTAQIDQGQRANQAIEDPGTISIFLSQVKDLKDISHCLELIQNTRRDRVSAMQIFSNAGLDKQIEERRRLMNMSRAQFLVSQSFIALALNPIFLCTTSGMLMPRRHTKSERFPLLEL